MWKVVLNRALLDFAPEDNTNITERCLQNHSKDIS